MALDHIGIQIDYTRLAKILRAGELFTPFGHLAYLERLGLSIIVGRYGSRSIFARNIAIGLPVIVGVKTSGWKHWGAETTDHAVVVVGIAPPNDKIFINDPFFAVAPIEMALGDFEVGWEEKRRLYAVIGLAPP